MALRDALRAALAVLLTSAAALAQQRMSDIDYYFASRLRGEPAGGVDDIHFHPAVPRTMRVGLVVGF